MDLNVDFSLPGRAALAAVLTPTCRFCLPAGEHSGTHPRAAVQAPHRKRSVRNSAPSPFLGLSPPNQRKCPSKGVIESGLAE